MWGVFYVVCGAMGSGVNEGAKEPRQHPYTHIGGLDEDLPTGFESRVQSMNAEPFMEERSDHTRCPIWRAM